MTDEYRHVNASKHSWLDVETISDFLISFHGFDVYTRYHLDLVSSRFLRLNCLLPLYPFVKIVLKSFLNFRFSTSECRCTINGAMFLLKTPPKKKTVLVIITLLSVLVISVELARYQYDGLHIGSDIFQWASKEELDHATDVNKESSNARSSSSRFMDNNQPAPIQHTPSSEEKYLTYLPYSRFSNQRSTLVNAALLAKYLNRTLIVPPMFLGSANGWSPAPGLYRVLANMTDSSFQDRCFDSNGQPILEEPVVPPEGEEVEFGCYNFTTYVMVPWSWATDLHRLTLPEEDGGLSIRIMERSDMSLGALQRQLGLLDDDMFLMQDDTVKFLSH